MKRIISLIICIFMLSSFVYANEAYVLNLEEAKTLAKTNNPQIEVVEVNGKTAEITLDAAKYAKAASKNTEVFFGDTHTPLVKKGYYVESAKSGILLNEAQLKQVKSKIDYDVTEKYYSYLLAERLVEIADNGEKLAKDNLDNVNMYFELGMAAQLDVKNAETNFLNATYTKNSYIRNAELAEESLKLSLNISADSELILTDSIVTEEYQSDVEVDILSAMESRYDILSLKEAARLSKLNLEIVRGFYLSNTANYNRAKSDSVQSEFNYTNNSRLIGLAVRNSYNNILTAIEKLDLATKDYEIKSIEYDVAKVKYEIGTITNAQLMAAQNAMSASQVQLENAKLEYLLAVEKYKYEITIGL